MPFAAASLVFVLPRTGPGVNKPGGVASVKEYDATEDTYTVLYVLDRRTEKSVPSSICSAHVFESGRRRGGAAPAARKRGAEEEDCGDSKEQDSRAVKRKRRDERSDGGKLAAGSRESAPSARGESAEAGEPGAEGKQSTPPLGAPKDAVETVLGKEGEKIVASAPGGSSEESFARTEEADGSARAPPKAPRDSALTALDLNLVQPNEVAGSASSKPARKDAIGASTDASRQSENLSTSPEAPGSAAPGPKRAVTSANHFRACVKSAFGSDKEVIEMKSLLSSLSHESFTPEEIRAGLAHLDQENVLMIQTDATSGEELVYRV